MELSAVCVLLAGTVKLRLYTAIGVFLQVNIRNRNRNIQSADFSPQRQTFV